MFNQSRAWLRKLLAVGALPASGIPNAAKADIANIAQAGFIRWERSGAGAKYTVLNEQAIHALLESTGYQGDADQLTPKSRAVALHGDAHRGRDTSVLLTMSSVMPGVVWSNGAQSLDVTSHSEAFGVASLIVRLGDLWKTNAPLGLVENLDLVVYGKEYLKRIGFTGCVLYYSGWMSNTLLKWLEETPRAPSITVFPDYDIVGLKNYIRAKERLGDSINIFVPDDLKSLLRKYGSKDKLTGETDRSDVERSTDKDVREIYSAMLEAGAGLDQECLLFV